MLTRLLGMALALSILAPSPVAGHEDRIAVIVHPSRRTELSIEELAQIYLRRKRFWDNGTVIVPLNLPSQAPLRARFSGLVLNQTETRLAEYWNRRYFDGILPPATLASTEAVRRYVASDTNAIGYVPASEVDGSVRVVLHLEKDGAGFEEHAPHTLTKGTPKGPSSLYFAAPSACRGAWPRIAAQSFALSACN